MSGDRKTLGRTKEIEGSNFQHDIAGNEEKDEDQTVQNPQRNSRERQAKKRGRDRLP